MELTRRGIREEYDIGAKLVDLKFSQGRTIFGKLPSRRLDYSQPTPGTLTHLVHTARPPSPAASPPKSNPKPPNPRPPGCLLSPCLPSPRKTRRPETGHGLQVSGLVVRYSRKLGEDESNGRCRGVYRVDSLLFLVHAEPTSTGHVLINFEREEELSIGLTSGFADWSRR